MYLRPGTPINTTVNDFKNQLEFLGLQKTTQLMGLFRQSFYLHVKDPSKKVGRRSRNWSGDIEEKHPGVGFFCFMMRSLMMRHSQQQTYSGTATALMSLPLKVSWPTPGNIPNSCTLRRRKRHCLFL